MSERGTSIPEHLAQFIYPPPSTLSENGNGKKQEAKPPYNVPFSEIGIDHLRIIPDLSIDERKSNVFRTADRKLWVVEYIPLPENGHRNGHLTYPKNFRDDLAISQNEPSTNDAVAHREIEHFICTNFGVICTEIFGDKTSQGAFCCLEVELADPSLREVQHTPGSRPDLVSHRPGKRSQLTEIGFSKKTRQVRQSHEYYRKKFGMDADLFTMNYAVVNIGTEIIYSITWKQRPHSSQ